jgi:hypothetical protein
MENIGNHKKLSPKNKAIPDPNDAPLANPNVKLSASGLFNTRLLEAMLTGAVLTLAGQVYQIVLNNPLADSFTLGLEVTV